MIVRTVRSGNVELRSTWGTDHIIPRPGNSWVSWAGQAITQDGVFGLPAVSNVVRSPSEVMGALPFMVYRSRETRERAEDSWQWQLLHEAPNDEQSTYEFFHDIEMSLESTQNAFVWKAKSSSRVEALYCFDPQGVRVYRDDNGQKRFDLLGTKFGDAKGLTTSEILHVRGYTPRPGAVCGVSLLQQHRDPLGIGIAMQRFEGDYFRNGAMPSFFFTGASNKTHAKELIELHNEQHQGTGKQFKVGGLWGQADVKPVPVSMVDAQFIESRRLGVEDACRIWRWPKLLMEITGERDPLDENAWTARFMKFYLLPRLKRIERAFAADPDLFAGQPLYGEFLTAALERADYVTRVRGYKDARQGGWITANEIREGENYPARPDGDSLLQTPTGSAPNPGDGGGNSMPDDMPSQDQPQRHGAFEKLTRANGSGDLDVEALLTGVQS